MGYIKIKKAKVSKPPVITDCNFDMSFLESMIITAALDGLIDQSVSIGNLSKGKRIHKLK